MVGQHIRAFKSGRWIHAIDCGDETVLHLVEDAAPQRVRRAYRPEFVAGAETVELVTHRERTFPPKEVVRRAYSRASDPALAAMFQDSEAFARWCTTGRLAGVWNVALGVQGAVLDPSAEAEAAAVPDAADAPAATPPPKTAASRPTKAKARAARAAAPAKARGSSRKGKARGARAAARSAPRRKVAARKPKAAKRKSGRRTR